MNIKNGLNKIWKIISRTCIVLVLLIVAINIIAYYSGVDSALGNKSESFEKVSNVKVKDQSFQILINREGTEVVFSDLQGNSNIYLVKTDLEHGVIMLQEK